MGKHSLKIRGNVTKRAKTYFCVAKYKLCLTLANGLGGFLVSKIKFH